MDEFEIKDGRLIRYHGEAAVVHVPAEVTEIGGGAFASCAQLQSITVPAGVTWIAEDAFRDCRNLRSVTLLGNETGIHDRAFEGCVQMESLVQGGTPYRVADGLVLEAEGRIFRWCIHSQTEHITLPEGVQEVGDMGFRGLEKLKSITFPSSLRRIGPGAFRGCISLKHLEFPEGVEEIGSVAFWDCYGVQSLTLPQSLRGMSLVSGLMFGLPEVRISSRPGRPLGPLLKEEGILEAVMDSLRCDRLIAPQLRWRLLHKEEHRRAALLGFIYAQKEGLAYTEEETLRAYGRQEREWLLSKAAEDGTVLWWLFREAMEKRGLES